MSDTKHTPGPWELKTTEGSDHKLCTIYSSKAGRGIARHVLPEDARRIVACVNACVGIPIEALNQLKPGDLSKLFFDPWEAD